MILLRIRRLGVRVPPSAPVFSFGKRLDVVTVEVEQIRDQPLERPGTQPGDNRAALGKGLKNAVELELAQGRAHMSASNAELRGELALRRKAIAGLQGPAREQLPDLAHDQVRRLFELNRAQLCGDCRALGHQAANWLTSD